jgi:hypothetical protein
MKNYYCYHLKKTCPPLSDCNIKWLIDHNTISPAHAEVESPPAAVAFPKLLSFAEPERISVINY